MLEKKHKYETPINSDHYQNDYPQIFSTIIDQTTKIFYTPHMVDNQANMNNIYQKTTPNPPPQLVKKLG